MVQINFASREVSVKIVYYGPGRSGKTTNLEQIHLKAPQDSKGELISIATETDRTLFFDFLPLDLGKIAGMTTKFQLYTVPGQVYYNATRKLVLQGTDGVIFIADSAPSMRDENVESLDNLIENLEENGLSIEELPVVFQWNKRDLPEVLSPEQMNTDMNRWNAPTCEAVAVKGEGVFKTLKLLASLVIKKLNKEHGFAEDGKTRVPAAGAPAAASVAKPAAQAATARPAAQPAARPSGGQPVRLAGSGPRTQSAAVAQSPATRPAAQPARTTQPVAPKTQPVQASPGGRSPGAAAPAARPGAVPAARPGAGPAARPGAGPAARPGAGPATRPGAGPAPMGGRGAVNPLSMEIKRRKEEAIARQQGLPMVPASGRKSQGKSSAPLVIILLLLLGAAGAAVYYLHFVKGVF